MSVPAAFNLPPILEDDELIGFAGPQLLKVAAYIDAKSAELKEIRQRLTEPYPEAAVRDYLSEGARLEAELHMAYATHAHLIQAQFPKEHREWGIPVMRCCGAIVVPHQHARVMEASVKRAMDVAAGKESPDLGSIPVVFILGARTHDEAAAKLAASQAAHEPSPDRRKLH